MEKNNPHHIWSRAPDDLELQSRQVDIWRVSLDASTPLSPSLSIDSLRSLEPSLSPDELQRAARFHFPLDRDRFLAAHGCLRHILARYLHCEPGQLSFSTGEYGKPALPPHQKIDFNLSHSGGYALIAITRDRNVGVDVERAHEDMGLINIADRYFSPREVSELRALPPEEQTTAFFNGWSRKEAYIKAHGLGLSLPLDSFDVSLDEPAVLRATRPDPQEAARWSLVSLEVDSGYTGALAVEVADPSGKAELRNRELEFNYWDWKFAS
jgi:4'-phosphopantetheinyl transferase